MLSLEALETQRCNEIKNWIMSYPYVALLAWRNFWANFGRGWDEHEAKTTLESKISTRADINPTLREELHKWVDECYGGDWKKWKDELKIYLLAEDRISTMKPYKEFNGSRTKNRFLSKGFKASGK